MKVVALAHRLEIDPLGKDSDKGRNWFKEWTRQTRIRTIPSCSNFFESEPRNKYSDELSVQFQMSTAAFLIEHTEQSQNPVARLVAGMNGMLSAYSKIVEAKKVHSAFLDSLLSEQRNNGLEKRAIEIMEKCSKEPLSHKNQRTGEVVYAPIEVEILPYIPRLPFPKYTAQAMHYHTTGKVVLHVTLGPTGTVTNIEVISGLRDGLTESSISAAKEIKIEPAQVNGKPVSILLKVEYTFIAQ